MSEDTFFIGVFCFAILIVVLFIACAAAGIFG